MWDIEVGNWKGLVGSGSGNQPDSAEFSIIVMV